MPEGLSEETQKFMKDVLKELNKKKAISAIDFGAMRMLASSYEMYLRSTDILMAKGPVIQMKTEPALNPAQNAATKNYAQVMKVMTEYGLTIKSREKINSVKESKKDDSPLGEYFKKNRVEKR